jgi:hypothetical protein
VRRAKTSATEGQPRGQIIDAVSIHERPAEVEDRAVPGHWEGDLLSGGKNTHVATLVERHSRFLMLVQVDGNDTKSVVDALVRQVQQLPRGLMSSLTWDRGMELAQHKRFAVAADAAVYFCDPAVLGSGAATRTPTVFCGSTCLGDRVFPRTARMISTRSPCGSTRDREKPLATKHQPLRLPKPLR